jgi:hypothetical protein
MRAFQCAIHCKQDCSSQHTCLISTEPGLNTRDAYLRLTELRYVHKEKDNIHLFRDSGRGGFLALSTSHTHKTSVRKGLGGGQALRMSLQSLCDVDERLHTEGFEPAISI